MPSLNAPPSRSSPRSQRGSMSDPVPIDSEDEMMDVDDYSGSSEDEQDVAPGHQVLRKTGVTARKGGWVYRQPAVQLINLSDHNTFQALCEELKHAILNTTSERQRKANQRCLEWVTEEHWGKIEGKKGGSSRREVGGSIDAEGYACNECRERGKDCLVRVIQNGRHGPHEVISRCICCMTSGRLCDIASRPAKETKASHPRIPRYNLPALPTAIRRNSAPPTRLMRGRALVVSGGPPLGTLGAGVSNTNRKCITVPIRAAPPPPQAPAPRVGATGAASSSTQSTLRYVAEFADRVRRMLLQEEDADEFMIGATLGVMSQNITGAARGPEDTTDQAGAAIIYVQNFTNHARTKLAVQIEKDFLISTMFDAMDMHLVTLTRVLGQL